MDVQVTESTCEKILGSLNDVERRFAPPRIFAAGDTCILEKGFRVSLVGSRNASTAGLDDVRKIAGMVARRGGVVVSGLAKGIDTAAHTGALDEGGKTIAVIGTPLDRSYPRENAKLQEAIMRDQLCISQFPSGYPTRPQNFPIRNRTMALFSDATVIIEASDTSGSLSQGWEALRLGRGLFVCDRLLNDTGLSWPKTMMAYGAQPLSLASLDDFFASLPERDATLELDALTL